MLSYCGLDCAECPAYLAHKNDDQVLRGRTALEWSRQYGAEFVPADINCAGCTQAEGVHIGHGCQCPFRNCGLAKELSNCGLCPDYPCQGLIEFHKTVPRARENLEQYRQAK